MRGVFSRSTKHAFFFFFSVLRMCAKQDAVVVGRYTGLSHGTGVYWPVAHGCGGIRLDSTWRHGHLSPSCALPLLLPFCPPLPIAPAFFLFAPLMIPYTPRRHLHVLGTVITMLCPSSLERRHWNNWEEFVPC